MKQLFHITNDQVVDKDMALLCEIGEQYFSIGEHIMDRKHIHTLSYFTFSHPVTPEMLRDVFNQHFHRAYTKVLVGVGFPQVSIVPDSFFGKADIKLFFPEPPPHNMVLHDAIEEWRLVAGYSLPDEIHRFFKMQDVPVHFQHVFTTELKIYNGFVAGEQISVHFTPQQFRVMVKKQGQLQLAQMYAYATPLDVVYYLLKIMEAFQLPKEETFCILSGLIERDSSLYRELENYFLNLHFTHPAVTITENEHPHHFFTSLFNLAACAS
ncbi:MAG: DUF3822 family protein [Flavisolibacter sp.]|nr:DUF3822 family protein [Flavisolibacter sp.]